MSATTIIAQAFGEGANLYTTVLGIKTETSSDSNTTKKGRSGATNKSTSSPAVPDTSSITPSQLRKAYYRRALLYHPDKQQSSPPKCSEGETKLKFQAVSLAYTILSDPSKRREYDRSGEIDDTDADRDDGDDNTTGGGTKAWTDYFRSVFGPVTPNDIDQFTSTYRCSDAERKDVLEFYVKFEGDLNRILECVMCSVGVEDKRRWVEDYIRPAVEDGSVEGGKLLEMVERTLEDDGDGGGDCDGDLDKEDLEEEDDEDDDYEDTDMELLEDDEEEDDDDDDGDDDTETDMDSDSNEDDHDNEEKKTSRQSSPKTNRRNQKITKVVNDDDDNGTPAKRKHKRNQPIKRSQKSTPSKRKSIDASTGSDVSSVTPLSNDLIAAIRGNRSERGASFGSMLAGIEERYGNGNGGSTKGRRSNKKSRTKKETIPPEDIPDEDFETIRARLVDSQRKKKKKKGKSVRGC